MSNGTAFALGLLLGTLLMTVLLLSTLMRYVSQDMDGFRKWLDRREL